jgi:hypothetical protein
MRRLLMIGLILILAGCAAQASLTSVPPLATISPPATASPRTTTSCLVGFGLDSYPKGSLATFSSIDGWSIGQGQLAVNIEGTLVLSSTSRMFILDNITETMRVSTGQASVENLQRLQELLGSAEFAALEPCYNSNALDAGALSFSATTRSGLKSGRASTGQLPPALKEFWSLMNTISAEATIPVSTCVHVTHLSYSGRELVSKDCE